jgi:hypothetical protein
MRVAPIKNIEGYRIRTGPMASSRFHGNNGAWHIPGPFLGEGKSARRAMLAVIASDGLGWEHVSVSLSDRTPTWEEMCYVKDLFWAPDECVIQYHPPRAEYVNFHEHCLHLWKPIGLTLPLPDSLLIGPKNAHELAAIEAING